MSSRTIYHTQPDPGPATVDLAVIGGVDTQSQTHYAAVLDHLGRLLATRQFPATRSGCQALLVWRYSFGTLERVGVEGTSSYGAGLTRYLISHGVGVIEVNRPNRQARRQHGKSDPLDAENAARRALSGEQTIIPEAPAAPWNPSGCYVSPVVAPSGAPAADHECLRRCPPPGDQGGQADPGKGAGGEEHHQDAEHLAGPAQGLADEVELQDLGHSEHQARRQHRAQQPAGADGADPHGRKTRQQLATPFAEGQGSLRRRDFCTGNSG